MPKRTSKAKGDLNQLAKAIVDEATGNGPPKPERSPESEAAALLGRRGGLKGGKARAKSLTKAERVKIARLAAARRWGKKM